RTALAVCYDADPYPGVCPGLKDETVLLSRFGHSRRVGNCGVGKRRWIVAVLPDLDRRSRRRSRCRCFRSRFVQEKVVDKYQNAKPESGVYNSRDVGGRAARETLGRERFFRLRDRGLSGRGGRGLCTLY